MKLLFATYGTEGDTRPFAALARYLNDSGDVATVMGDAGTLGFARSLGVPVHPLAGDIAGALGVDGSIGVVVRQSGGLRATAQALAGIANAQANAWLEAMLQAGRDCDAIVVSGLAAFAGFSAAEKLGVPALGAGLIPLTATREFPHPFLPDVLPGKWLNRYSYGFVNKLLWQAFRAATNKARQEVCALPPRMKVWDGHPMLYGISPAIVPTPADWPNNAHICGQWVARNDDFSAEPALEAFLAAGEAPLYVGFGSMLGFDADALMAQVVAALDGRRAVFYAGWSGAQTAQLPKHVFAVGSTPHSWLFPRMRAAIHHGGSGTSHSAVRAGIPSVVVPFAGDQAFWGRRLEAAGVGVSLHNSKKLSAERLRAALQRVESPQFVERAATLGRQLAREDAMSDTAALIHRHVSAMYR